ncbi:metalloprotease TldD [methanotrophic endosymbiont of Bathymodiolus puteoserpentis (Logatchev)]|jgi:TldD protein|uniref:metalloprotease TldD n=1 Tax=methanotrophic endosymbiont of Bathymodiolus puteoserpentis (Logatchev) TaxID=343235 RepID=UPI0013C632A6|nr:metalloprotease TldD [methanotrophic endosymbiont of Bathymodiolus puteoserpentis (Logatchev)]SHE21876.1 TldD protein, part of TldE/TldD proteolytic complex [methanotrophic endosymbiont of Bathymodiolus puteoserpentis (Logatchev)]
MDNTVLQLAKQAILVPTGLQENDIHRVLDQLISGAVDDGDIYIQSSHYESWVLEDGIVKEANHNIEQGAGVRALSGEKTGLAYSDKIELAELLTAAKNVLAIARQGQNAKVAMTPKTGVIKQLYAPLNPLRSLSDQEKVDFLRKIDVETRKIDPRIEQVIISLVGVQEHILIANQGSSLLGDVRPLVRMNVSVIVADKGQREQGSMGGGARSDYNYFFAQDRALGYAQEAVRQALVNLEAIPAPAGSMTVVLGSGWPGILLHEAIGHGLEGDFNRKGTSAFSGRIGERVASSLCTIVDDGTLDNRRGSLSIDDEGTPTQCTTLIENGILKGYMQDRLNARLMGTQSTGNGRRESYAHTPMPRMTNTYMLPGESDPEEILRSVKNGLYAKNFGGGQVDITSGKFVFSASEAYLIENGKITQPVKGATLIGNGPEVLTRVSMVGNDLELDSGVGTCGKEGQSVPVGVGQPTLKIDALTVGGTNV